jgi:hypothetical protein
MEIDGKEWSAKEIAALDEDGYRGLLSRSRVHGDFPDQIDFIEESYGKRTKSNATHKVEVAAETVSEPKIVKEEDEDNPYPEWTVAELREELGERGLDNSGKKSVLIARLEEDDAN